MNLLSGQYPHSVIILSLNQTIAILHSLPVDNLVAVRSTPIHLFPIPRNRALIFSTSLPL